MILIDFVDNKISYQETNQTALDFEALTPWVTHVKEISQGFSSGI